MKKNFIEKVREQNESIEGFKNVVDDLGDEKIKIQGDIIEGMKIELMRKSIEARCDKYDMSEFEKVKVIVEIIQDALTLEDKLRVYMDKNELADLEQDGVGN